MAEPHMQPIQEVCGHCPSSGWLLSSSARLLGHPSVLQDWPPSLCVPSSFWFIDEVSAENVNEQPVLPRNQPRGLCGAGGGLTTMLRVRPSSRMQSPLPTPQYIHTEETDSFRSRDMFSHVQVLVPSLRLGLRILPRGQDHTATPCLLVDQTFLSGSAVLSCLQT